MLGSEFFAKELEYGGIGREQTLATVSTSTPERVRDSADSE